MNNKLQSLNKFHFFLSLFLLVHRIGLCPDSETFVEDILWDGVLVPNIQQFIEVCEKCLVLEDPGDLALVQSLVVLTDDNQEFSDFSGQLPPLTTK